MKSEKVRVITAKPSFIEYWKEVFDYRELFWILAKRDIMVRYKQTIFGVLWSILRPLISSLVYVFGVNKIGNLGANSEIPYILIILPGTILWLFFSQSLLNISLSIVTNNNLVAKVFFPRIIIPFSSFFLGLLDFLIGLIVFFGFSFYYGLFPEIKIIFTVLFVVLAYLATTGIGLFAAVLNVKYRDIGQLIPFVLSFGLFISPVLYTTDKVMGDWTYNLYVLNPAVGAIDGLRWALLGEHAQFNWDSFIPLVVFCIVSVFISIRFFRKHENSFVDYI
ncbi:ABC transporter permease [Jiulongibacter sediminis]|uniref:Transport permease protein n=1 Tax=Jiulongibacter sediminis TaxID=1605367 RepID=A0A0P7BYB3_9BACT|nr:ABC transporter permease [Jiulongibacter sediminis]KPM49837.1 phosphate ABC transporter permease [Jiulongibacter sediminis]TBX26873.1 phosphate ABC transporter permease [Jiulongibacter sediminis]